MRRFLILDSISLPTLPEGKELYQALAALTEEQDDVAYAGVLTQKARRGYKILRGLNQFKQRQLYRNRGFFRFPRNTPELVKQICDYKPTHIIWIGSSYSYISKKAYLDLKSKMNFMSVLIDVEINNSLKSAQQLWCYCKNEVPIHDKVLMVSKRMTNYLQSLGNDNVHFFPACAKPVEVIPKAANRDIDVLFFGIPSVRRIVVMEALSDHNVTIVGDQWGARRRTGYVLDLISDRLKKHIVLQDRMENELYRLVARSKIVLNVSTSGWFIIESGVNVRFYRALAYGSFFLTEHCDEINDVFSVGEDLETYRSIEELQDKVTFYLNHDDLREKIARQGHQTFLKYHTMQRRAEQLLQHLEMTHPTLEWRSHLERKPIKNKIAQTLD